MKKTLFLISLISIGLFNAKSQNNLTKNNIDAAQKLLDLNFNEPKRDSMLGNLEEFLRVYKLMHGNNLQNSEVPMLGFDPTDAFQNFKAKNIVKKNDFSIEPKVCELPKNKEALAFYSVQELSYLIKNKKITSIELTQFFLNRLKKFGDTLHCVITLTESRAMESAARADKEIQAGKWRGLLHGIPYGAKDLIAVNGATTTWGAKPFKNQSFDYDATVINKLDIAGAVLIAKLSLGALAMDDFWFGGLTRNPWDIKTGSSGSSAGSASATSAGLVPFAIGSETYGSIVAPSGVCGASGLRPTFGRVSRAGAMTLCWSLDKLGPITRNATDAAIVFNAILGIDEKDKSTHESFFKFPVQKAMNKMRIGIIKEVFDTLNPNRNEWNVVNTLKKLGAELVSISFKTSVPTEITDIILNAECAAAFDAFTRNHIDDEMNGQKRGDWPNTFRSARFIPAVEYINAQRLRKKMILQIDSIIRHFDAILCPNYDAITLNLNFENSQLGITNATGHPAVVVPSGFNNGFPTSVTFLGNYFDEATILSIANAYQEQSNNHLKHPEMFTKN